jgi:hypothetical protein
MRDAVPRLTLTLLLEIPEVAAGSDLRRAALAHLSVRSRRICFGERRTGRCPLGGIGGAKLALGLY